MPYEELPDAEPQGMTLRDYVGVLSRRWWVIALVVVVATAAALLFSLIQTPVYQATAKIMYEPRLDVSDPLSGTGTTSNDSQAELEGVATVIASPVLAKSGGAAVAASIGAQADYTVTAVVEQPAGNATSSMVADVNAQSDDPKTAQAAANGYAAAFIAYKKQQQRVQVFKAIKALRQQMKGYTGSAKISTDYLILSQRLQDLLILASTVTGDFSLVVPAALPTSPVSPKPLRSGILGFAVGLFAGIGLAFLLEQFDNGLHGAKDVSRILKQPIIGRIPRFVEKEGADREKVVVLSNPDGHAAEAFRVLRGNLDFLSLDKDLHSAAVTSALQGEGKSVTCCNLAIALTLAGKRVILVDGDMRRPRAHKYLGLQNEQGVTTVVTGKDDLVSACQIVEVAPPNPDDPVTNGSGGRLYVLTSGPKPPNPGEVVASQRFADLIKECTAHAEIVLLDTPAFLAVGDTAAMARAVDGLVFLVDPGVTKQPTLEAAAERLAQLPTPVLGAIVMQRRGGGGSYKSEYYYGHYYYYYTAGDDQRKRRRSHKAPATG